MFKRSSKIVVVVVTLSSIMSGAELYGQEIEEIVITAVNDTSILHTENTLVSIPDTAQLLKKMPGANINKNGELTGIAQYRGMYGDRINISINGGHISSGGPNAMDAPLHYAPVALLESLSIHRGIVPVSVGQETIGGSIEAITYDSDFADGSEFQVSGRVYAGIQKVNDGNVFSSLLALANDQHRWQIGWLQEEGDDSDFDSGTIRPSEYERERVDVSYGYRQGSHDLGLAFVRNETGDAGTVALPMDIQSIDSDLLNLHYQWQGEQITLSLDGSINKISHEMSNFHLRRAPQGNAMMSGPMLYRQVQADSDNSGFKIQLEQKVVNGLWRYGLDGHFSEHDVLIVNPNANAFLIQNFSGVKRNILGAFIESEMKLDSLVGLNNTGVEFGLRINQIKSDADKVAANLNPMNQTMGMPVMMNNMAQMLAGQFNAQQVKLTDYNVDWFTRLSISSSEAMTWYLGVARKSRAPSYQERYLWLPLESTAGLADGKTYIGNTSLDAEVAHEIEVGFDWETKRWSVYPRIFYKQVKDYIQGTPVTNIQVNMFAQMMANMGMGQADPLQFNNVEASFYGFDVESNWNITSALRMRLLLSSVNGERDDIDDKLYRIPARNVLLGLDYFVNNWSASVELVAYAKQDRVAQTNLEQETPGYGVINASYRIELANGVELGLGIDNLLDRHYKDHLAGYNRAYNADINLRERLPGPGRNIYGRLIWKF